MIGISFARNFIRSEFHTIGISYDRIFFAAAQGAPSFIRGPWEGRQGDLLENRVLTSLAGRKDQVILNECVSHNPWIPWI